MPLVSMHPLLKEATKNNTAVGAFLPWDYNSALAIARTAKRLNAPVIFLTGDQDALGMGGFKFVADMARKISDDLDQKIVMHADHFRDYDKIVQAIVGGYSSVMIDASRLPIEENIALTRDVVKVAHANGVSVEAEIGRLPGIEGDEDVTVAESFQTDPGEAAYFVEQTGVDALAVSIGTMHGNYPKNFKPELNIPRLKQIKEKVAVPLVLHGGSGTPEEQVCEAVKAGIAKVNIATDVYSAYQRRLSELMLKEPGKCNLGYFAQASSAIEELVEHKIKLFNSNKE